MPRIGHTLYITPNDAQPSEELQAKVSQLESQGYYIAQVSQPTYTNEWHGMGFLPGRQQASGMENTFVISSNNPAEYGQSTGGYVSAADERVQFAALSPVQQRAAVSRAEAFEEKRKQYPGFKPGAPAPSGDILTPLVMSQKPSAISPQVKQRAVELGVTPFEILAGAAEKPGFSYWKKPVSQPSYKQRLSMGQVGRETAIIAPPKFEPMASPSLMIGKAGDYKPSWSIQALRYAQDNPASLIGSLAAAGYLGLKIGKELTMPFRPSTYRGLVQSIRQPKTAIKLMSLEAAREPLGFVAGLSGSLLTGKAISAAVVKFPSMPALKSVTGSFFEKTYIKEPPIGKVKELAIQTGRIETPVTVKTTYSSIGKLEIKRAVSRKELYADVPVNIRKWKTSEYTFQSKSIIEPFKPTRIIPEQPIVNMPHLTPVHVVGESGKVVSTIIETERLPNLFNQLAQAGPQSVVFTKSIFKGGKSSFITESTSFGLQPKIELPKTIISTSGMLSKVSKSKVTGKPYLQEPIFYSGLSATKKFLEIDRDAILITEKVAFPAGKYEFFKSAYASKMPKRFTKKGELGILGTQESLVISPKIRIPGSMGITEAAGKAPKVTGYASTIEQAVQAIAKAETQMAMPKPAPVKGITLPLLPAQQQVKQQVNIPLPMAAMKISASQIQIQLPQQISIQLPKVASMFGGRTRTEERLMPAMAQIQISRTAFAGITRQEQIQLPQQISIQLPKVAAIQMPRQAQLQLQKQATLQLTRMAQLQVPRMAFTPSTPIAPPPGIITPPPPFIFKLPKMNFNLGDLSSGMPKARKITDYMPSFSALMFGIKGRYKKTSFAMSGLDFRPITKGWSILGRKRK